MKILIISTLFEPSIGGMETVAKILAEEFAAAGHKVRLITEVHAVENNNYPFEIHRNISLLELLKHLIWCDVFLQNSLSLRFALPRFLVPKPWYVIHHTWYQRPNGEISFRDKVKLYLCKFANNISVSSAIAKSIPGSSIVIPNPYQSKTFRSGPSVLRTKDILCVGRLVSDKGVDLVIRALDLLKKRNLAPILSIVGDGPELEKLKNLVCELQLDSQVSFCGSQSGNALSDLYRSHKICVIPSRWQEPFGIVALEAIACGCTVIASRVGGLPEAIGSCGLTFPRDDLAALAKLIEDTLIHPERSIELLNDSSTHLEKHLPIYVAQEYLKVLRADSYET
ncbi:MAG: glycosyltransferase family 4 protein [Bdellovibrionales bacterium]|nr:glycosyltransferase family 4 protein [Bdellovibrionales bacterium]